MGILDSFNFDQNSIENLLRFLNVPYSSPNEIFYFFLLSFFVGIISLEIVYTFLTDRYQSYWKDLTYLSKFVIALSLGTLSTLVVWILKVIFPKIFPNYGIFIISFLILFTLSLKSVSKKSGREAILFIFAFIYFILVLLIIVIFGVLLLFAIFYKDIRSIVILLIILFGILVPSLQVKKSLIQKINSSK